MLPTPKGGRPPPSAGAEKSTPSGAAAAAGALHSPAAAAAEQLDGPAAAAAADPALAAASPAVWKSVSPQSLATHSVRERQRLQLTTLLQYEQQSFTITGATGGTFRLKFEDIAAVSAGAPMGG